MVKELLGAAKAECDALRAGLLSQHGRTPDELKAFADDLADAQGRLDAATEARFQREWADNKARLDADPESVPSPWWDPERLGPLSDAVRQARARDEALGRDGAAGVAELHGRLIAESVLLGLGAGAAVKVGAKAAQFGRSADAGYRALMQRLVDASASGPRSGQPYGGPIRGASGTAPQQLHQDVVKLLGTLWVCGIGRPQPRWLTPPTRHGVWPR